MTEKDTEIGSVHAPLKRWSHATVMLILLVAALLGVRATQEFRWGEWIGSAQTMLAARVWKEDGWISSKLLFTPSGYFSSLELLDDPELLQHAHGIKPITVNGEKIGPRLRYTHYPVGYFIPFAALMEAGATDHRWFHGLAILFSVTGLLLFHLSIQRLLDPHISFFAIGFYVCSYPFLGFSDVLANQPIDNLYRFLFIYLTVREADEPDAARAARFLYASLAVQFALSLSSFDSVFFVFAWRLLFDLLILKRFRPKVWIAFALVPIAAHALQFLQNVWYLGWSHAWIDASLSAQERQFNWRIYNLWNDLLALRQSIGLLLPSAVDAALAAALAIFAAMAFLKDWKAFRIALLFLLSGTAFLCMLPGAGMPYQGQQILPFVGLVFAWGAVKGGGLIRSTSSGTLQRVVGGGAVGGAVFLAAVNIWDGHRHINMLVGDKYTHPFLNSLVNNDPAPAELAGLTVLRSWGDNRVVLNNGGLAVVSNYVEGYPQANPLYAHYLDAPVLSFTTADLLIADLETLFAKAERPFTPIVLTKDAARMESSISATGRWTIAKKATLDGGIAAIRLAVRPN